MSWFLLESWLCKRRMWSRNLVSTRKLSPWCLLVVPRSERMSSVSTKLYIRLWGHQVVSSTSPRKRLQTFPTANCSSLMKSINCCQSISRVSLLKSLRLCQRTSRSCSFLLHTLWRLRSSSPSTSRPLSSSISWRNWLSRVSHSTMPTLRRRRSFTVWTPYFPSLTSTRLSSSVTRPREWSFLPTRFNNLGIRASTFTQGCSNPTVTASITTSRTERLVA